MDSSVIVTDIGTSLHSGFRGIGVHLGEPLSVCPASTASDISNLVTRPHEMLQKIRNKTSVHLASLGECSGCVADRGVRPWIREEVERLTVEAVSHHCNKKTSIDVVVFADSGLFQTLVLIQKLAYLKRLKEIRVAIIDPFFASLCVDPAKSLTEEERAVRVHEVPRIRARCRDFLAWFEFQQGNARCRVSLAAFHHVSRWILARRPADVVLAIDWLDEMGSLPSGGAIRGDWAMLKLFLPPRTLIVDFNVVNNLQLCICTRSGRACDFDVLRVFDGDNDNDNKTPGTPTTKDSDAMDPETPQTKDPTVPMVTTVRTVPMDLEIPETKYPVPPTPTSSKKTSKDLQQLMMNVMCGTMTPEDLAFTSLVFDAPTLVKHILWRRSAATKLQSRFVAVLVVLVAVFLAIVGLVWGLM